MNLGQWGLLAIAVAQVLQLGALIWLYRLAARADAAAMHVSRPVAAAHVLWVVGSPHEAAMRPGGFVESLIRAMLRADVANLHRLEAMFPAYAAMVRVARDLDAGPQLERIAARTLR